MCAVTKLNLMSAVHMMRTSVYVYFTQLRHHQEEYRLTVFFAYLYVPIWDRGNWMFSEITRLDEGVKVITIIQLIIKKKN